MTSRVEAYVATVGNAEHGLQFGDWRGYYMRSPDSPGRKKVRACVCDAKFDRLCENVISCTIFFIIRRFTTPSDETPPQLPNTAMTKRNETLGGQ